MIQRDVIEKVEDTREEEEEEEEKKRMSKSSKEWRKRTLLATYLFPVSPSYLQCFHSVCECRLPSSSPFCYRHSPSSPCNNKGQYQTLYHSSFTPIASAYSTVVTNTSACVQYTSCYAIFCLRAGYIVTEDRTKQRNTSMGQPDHFQDLVDALAIRH
ncbi:hypothetical protein DPX16_13482 [Anabarilius grahami]|uniref:Uncharacterized protein n=1 Tax=Anabarilius grahami TaxID=495550 RepID=A0A3N0YCG2_ANAGA|nr:hypothetical protein DPX16_13482 [Anabarilius grahami]